MSSPTFTIRELQRSTGVPVRTLRRWTKSKLLPKAMGRGRAARYGTEHLLRAQLIRQLRGERRSLREIRERLITSSLEQLAARLPRPLPTAVLTVPPAALPVPTVAPPVPPAEPAYPFTRWEVVQLSAGLALLVNPAQGPAVRRLAEQLYRQCAGLTEAS
jgi:DNA-binding transcriptional MerR regulator